MEKIVLSMSGGLDSAVLLSHIAQTYPNTEIIPVNFFYGSKHNNYERAAAEKIVELFNLKLTKIQIAQMMKHFKSDLLLSGGAIPEGHYEDDSMKATVVPCRNMIFASILAGIAESMGASKLFLGVHAGDHHIYPDCRPDFFESMKMTIHHATEGKVSLQAPFLFFGKGQIVKRGIELSTPFHFTRTCYKEQREACGKCGSCMERLLAFEQNGIDDPIKYMEVK